MIVAREPNTSSNAEGWSELERASWEREGMGATRYMCLVVAFQIVKGYSWFDRCSDYVHGDTSILEAVRDSGGKGPARDAEYRGLLKSNIRSRNRDNMLEIHTIEYSVRSIARLQLKLIASAYKYIVM